MDVTHHLIFFSIALNGLYQKNRMENLIEAQKETDIATLQGASTE